MIRYELVEGQYSARVAELGPGLCTIEDGFVYYSPDVEADLDLFVGKTLRLKFDPSIIAMPDVRGLWCNGVVALFCDRALVRFVDKKAKKARPKIKCLELPRYCQSVESIAFSGLVESDSLPTLDRNGWYKMNGRDWIEFEGKVYVPIGDFDAALEIASGVCSHDRKTKPHNPAGERS